jgi:hypothetical protein
MYSMARLNAFVSPCCRKSSIRDLKAGFSHKASSYLELYEAYTGGRGGRGKVSATTRRPGCAEGIKRERADGQRW